MRKLYSILVIFIIFNIMFLSTSPSFARGQKPDYYPHYHNGKFYTERSSNGHKPYDYDLEYMRKILKQDKKTYDLSKKYLEKLKTAEVKTFAQGVIEKKEKQIQQLEKFITDYSDKIEN